MRHKGYVGVLEIDEEAGLLFGRVLGLKDSITFQGRTVEEARRSFAESVDFYLDVCRDQGVEPETPFSGRILIRANSDLHRALAVKAAAEGISINTLARRALAREVKMPMAAGSAARKAAKRAPARTTKKSSTDAKRAKAGY